MIEGLAPVLFLVIPIVIVLTCLRFKYDLVAPAPLFGIVWSLALAGALQPPFNDRPWVPEMWLLAILPPVILVGAAIAASGEAPFNRSPLGIHLSMSGVSRSTWLLPVMVLIGTVVFAYEFAGVGGIPLLSPNADELRFRLVTNPFLHIATRLVPVAAIIAGLAIAATRGRQRFIMTGVILASLIVLSAQASRLEVFLIAGAVSIALYLALRVDFRVWMAFGVVAVVAMAFSSWLFLHRAGQHSDDPFERRMFEEIIPSRGPFLAWTVPAQVGIAGGTYVLSELVRTDALAHSETRGLYLLHGVDRYFPAKDSQAVAASVTAPLIAPTFLADPYGDFGILGAVVWCLVSGLAFGRLYRAAVRTASLPVLLVYAYVAFWLGFSVYVNIWSYFIFWVFDIAFLWTAGAILSGDSPIPDAIRRWDLRFVLGRIRARPRG